ncbi:hypothetical protein GCM10027187_51780 [Streptosporangium sandarakinum]
MLENKGAALRRPSCRRARRGDGVRRQRGFPWLPAESRGKGQDSKTKVKIKIATDGQGRERNRDRDRGQGPGPEPKVEAGRQGSPMTAHGQVPRNGRRHPAGAYGPAGCRFSCSAARLPGGTRGSTAYRLMAL